jgi:hypothetical protein
MWIKNCFLFQKQKTEIEMFEIWALRRIFGEGRSNRRLEKTT